MSRAIDERVVSMQFDNAQFERNVKTSMSTLDKLKQSLNFNGATKGLENINSVAKGLNFAPLSNGIEVVKNKFSALEVMAVTTLANITNSAVNAGKRIASSFTIDPIKTGFQEYETQINAIQTIMSNTRSKGTTLDDVNAALDELNHYADMTIYNFTEMTRNIGTFTAAGVDLKTSVSAIKGIANLAAVSGSTSMQASTAMYQLSQALASGTVKLQDWNSVVNAGMGGQVFQDALKETARVHGIAIDDMIKSEGSFRETLQKGWLSSEILTETLSKFTGDLTEEQLKSMGYTDEQAKSIMALGEDANNAATKVKTFTQLLDTLKEAAQSGWTQTWEYIVGDFEDAKKLWTSVSDTLSEMINNSAEARNKVVGEWAENGGRAAAIEAIGNAFKALMNIIKPITEAFREIFPPTTSDQLIKMTEKVKDLTAAFKEWTEKYGPQIKSTFKGIFAVVDIFATAIKKTAAGMVKLIGSIANLGSGLIEITGSLGNWLSDLKDSVKETGSFGKALDSVVGFLQKGIDAIKRFFQAAGEKVDSSGLEGFLKILTNIWDFLSKIGKKIGTVFSDFFRSGDLETGLSILNGGLLASLLIGLKKFFSGGALDSAADFFGALIKPLENFKEKARPVKSMLDELKGCLQAYQQDLKAKTLIKVAGAIAILVAAIFVLSEIDPGKLGGALTGMGVLFTELVAAMATLDKFAGHYKNSSKAVIMMVGMSTSILLLAAALRSLSSLSLGELTKGLAGVLGLMTILVGATNVMGKNEKRFKKGASQMILMAFSLKILASVCKDLSVLSLGELAKSVMGIAGILVVFAGFQTLMSRIKPTKMIKSALSLAIIGAAMEIFADVSKKFGSMDWGSLGKAGAAIGSLLAIAAGFALLSGLSKKMASSSIALVIIGASMEIFADVCKKFGSMEWGSLAKAGAAVGSLLALASGFMLLSQFSKKMAGSVISLTIIGAAMEIFADVSKKFGSMDWGSLGKAGAAIGGILLLVSGFALLSNLSPGMLSASASLLVMAAALSILTLVLTTLGGMSWGSIVKGLVAVAAAFALIWAAGVMLTPVIPSILALSGAIALLGIAALAFGAGVTLLATGVAALAVALGAGAASIVSSVLIILEGLGKAIILIGEAIIEGAAVIGAAIAAVVLATIAALAECIPEIVAGALKIFVGVLKALATYAPMIVNYLVDFLIGILDALGERIPDLIQAAMQFLGKLFLGIADALGGLDTETLVNALLAIGVLSAFMLALNAIKSLIPGAMIGVLGVAAVVAELGIVLAAIGGLAQIPGLKWLISEGGNFLQTIGTAIGKFIGGIIGGIAAGATSTMPEIGTNLSSFMQNLQPFIDGAKAIDPSVVEGIKTLAQAVLAITGADLLSAITSFFTGGNPLERFSSQLIAFGENMKQYGEVVNGLDTEAISSSANAAKALSDLSNSMPKSDGWAQTILGSKDLDSFGNKLVSFGGSIKSYSNTVSGIDSASLDGSTKSLKDLVAFVNEASNTNYDNLDRLGLSLNGFALDVKRLDSESIKISANAISTIAKVYSDISGTDFSAFESLGTSIKHMADDISALDSSSLDSVSASLTRLGKTSIASFAQGIYSGGSQVNEAGRSLTTSLVAGLRSGMASVESTINLIANSVTNCIRSNQGTFETGGKMLILKFGLGIKSGSSGIKTVFSALLSQTVTGVRAYYMSFYNAGAYLAKGFANGISQNSYRAAAKAKAMAKAAEEAARRQLKEHSPSKVFIQMGKFVSEGFARGIDNASWMGTDSASSMASNAIKSTSKAISRIASVVSDNIDTQPTIRPVLDLSGIYDGANRLNGMLDVSPSVGVLSNTQAINSMMNNSQNGATNDDVISAIRNLGQTIGNTSSSTNVINGITYDDGTNVAEAVKALVRATRLERRT